MTRRTGHLLFDEAPIAVNPSAIRLLGLAEAVLLQQLHYRLRWKEERASQYAAHFIDGRFWMHWSTAELQQEAPLGRNTTDPYKRVTKNLRDLGILLVEQHRRAQWDRTNWYSIDYDAFERYAAAHGGPRAASRGGNATDREVAKPPNDERETARSSRGNSTGHSQSKNSSETSNKTTTTQPDLRASERHTPGGGGDASRELDLSGLPARLHKGVRKAVATRCEAQHFVDLLAARIARDGELPTERQLKNPLLWLRRMLETQGVVDFSEAERLDDQRARKAEAARRESVRAAREREAESQQDAARRERNERAQAVLSNLPAADREALEAAILANRLVGAHRTRAVEAIQAGRLPEAPMALHATLQALETLSRQQPGAAA